MALADDIAALPITPVAGATTHLTDTATLHAAAKSHETRVAANAAAAAAETVRATAAEAANTTAIAAKYTKPTGGIPNSDLATPGTGSAAATTTTQGIVKLAGDFGGTADLPTVPALAGKLSSTDPSVTNSRTPTAHATTHATGGSDVLTPAAIGAATTTALSNETTRASVAERAVSDAIERAAAPGFGAIPTLNPSPPLAAFPTLPTPVISSITTATTGGTLTGGVSYYYRVSATNGGETLASVEVSVVVPAGTSTNTATPNWSAVSGASGYKVYGRTTGAEQTIATVGAVTTYTDTGSITPSGALPTTNTSQAKNTSTAISGSVQVPLDQAGACTFFGARPSRGTSFPRSACVTGFYTYSATTSPAPFAVEFDLDTVDATGRFEINLMGTTGNGIRVLTRNGMGPWQQVTAGNTFIAPADGSFYCGLVTLGAPGHYGVRLECSPGTFLAPLNTAPTDTLRATSVPRRRVIVVGDSYTEPTIVETGTYAAWDGWVQIMSRTLGVDAWSAGSGGTGYLAISGPRVKFRDRLSADVIPFAPDEVWFAGGHNDTAFTSAQVAAEATLCIQQIQAALPKARIVVTSPYPNSGSEYYPPIYVSIREALRTVAANTGAIFLDAMNLPLPMAEQPASSTVATATTAGATQLIINGQTWPTRATSLAMVDGATDTLAEIKRVTNVVQNGDGTTTLTVTPGLTYAHAVGVPVSVVGQGMLTGNGKQGTPTNNGNSDRYVGADGTHPTVQGHRNLAEIATVLRLR